MHGSTQISMNSRLVYVESSRLSKATLSENLSQKPKQNKLLM